MPIPACLRRETQNFLHAVAFTSLSEATYGDLLESGRSSVIFGTGRNEDRSQPKVRGLISHTLMIIPHSSTVNFGIGLGLLA